MFWLNFAKLWIMKNQEKKKSLAYQGKDIVFRFIIEYNSLRDFCPY